jgi:hypothetical protein
MKSTNVATAVGIVIGVAFTILLQAVLADKFTSAESHEVWNYIVEHKLDRSSLEDRFNQVNDGWLHKKADMAKVLMDAHMTVGPDEKQKPFVLPSGAAPTVSDSAAEQTAFSAVAKTLILITPVQAGDDVYKAKAIVKPAQCEIEVRREHPEANGPLVPWLVHSINCK